MTTKKDLLKVQEEVYREWSAFDDHKDNKRVHRNFALVGLGALAYVGLRSFIGPELFSNDEIINFR